MGEDLDDCTAESLRGRLLGTRNLRLPRNYAHLEACPGLAPVWRPCANPCLTPYGLPRPPVVTALAAALTHMRGARHTRAVASCSCAMWRCRLARNRTSVSQKNASAAAGRLAAAARHLCGASAAGSAGKRFQVWCPLLLLSPRS